MKNIRKAKPIKSESNNKSILNIVLEGELLVSNGSQIKEKLLQINENNLEKIVLIKNVMAIDLSFVQIIIALKKSIQKNNIPCTIIWDLDFDKKSLLTNAGFDYLLTN